ncbi:pilus assembly protein TadG-related protein [Corynebacterium sp. 153RC1]|uniref:Rv3654c family TadE-like protein n=1 Tax=Corynebacterium TaxID=1716 RepID=UPI00211C07F5|nr:MULTISPECIES: Rv3654c family TadE-like protein [unclassified Corynebacterium]MCQ9370613.1 pilus assembly protein TadG-related protein [Corynebacterium sp. 35RC1]MCQ9342715.1 pilus assembly protein TadG-related protein [Corynebacterium sp. 76QC2CO]MCQ9351732.1 pilus assembly protein TadG-related protein [Corynebacterium sp. 209RC1]MCQ9354468.1 pilus assembly protein TadG-related protein [Corynebacterium sp. 1222RC1]MCQ9356014.1 pilus assembly protein TadG-related protein [Corynebacterium sp.
MTPHEHTDDARGNMTIFAAGIACALTAILLAAVGAASLVLQQHKAQVAADMAAIAGATSLMNTTDADADACATASTTAHANNAELTSCTIYALDVQVSVRVGLRTAQANAGPHEQGS